MAELLTLYVCGDQTYQPNLKGLLRYRQNAILEDFLVKAYDAIRTEIYKLPHHFRDDLPRFTCFDDLAMWKQDEKRCVALDMAVTCMYQLGLFISQADPSYPCVDNARILGICSGTLAAAAISCASSTLDLVPLAVSAVIVAFRTGMHVTDVGERLERSQDSDQTWAMIVFGPACSEGVDRFNEETALPLTSRPYISSYSPNGNTVSGPPSSLELLSSSEEFKNIRFKRIPIHGPYHSPHLFSQEDIEYIVGDLTIANSDLRPNKIPVFSSVEAVMEEGNFTSLLKAAVRQILLQPIRWNTILEELQKCIQRLGPKSFSIVPIGTTADQLIYAQLKQTPLRALLPERPTERNAPLLEDPSLSSPKKPKLAIIGMSGRFPGAKDNEAFWDLLYQGLDVHKSVPPLRWDANTHVDPTGNAKNTSATPFGCWLDEPAVFDARFFNISPREAPQIDPAQRLALMTAYEAIEQAGIVPDTTPSTRRDRVGVFYGVTSNDWMETNSAQNIDTYLIPGGNRAFIPGRINYYFKFSGPSYAIDTACSSSLAGIHLACNSLWRGDIDTAIAGGTNVLTNPDFTAGLDRGHFLSRTGNCKTFDDSADGYCRGEGVGTVIIKRLEDAIADNDPIQGLILGAYTNHSAESESITRPHVGAQRAIFRKVLNQAAVDPYTISYVEMHGTGTQAGDSGEMSSVLETFAPPLNKVKKGRSTDQALYLGSAKANIGHGEAASGVSSVIKTLLMMQKNTIVPHCGIKTKINHRFPTDLLERNVRIAKEPTLWERNSDASKPRRVFVNNFSAAGGNTALLLEDAPLQQNIPTKQDDPRGPHVIAVSAKNGVSLQGNLKSLLGFLKQNPDLFMSQLSYTTTARRIHHQHRVMLTGIRIEDICDQIEGALRDDTGMTRPKGAPKILFAFTGQGAQYPGMGKQLFDNFSLFRSEMRRLDTIGKSLGFPSLLPVIHSKEQDINNFAPTAVQLASVCMQIALTKLWASWNITPIAVIGHSLGEYAALNVAGVLSDADAVYLVGKRAELLEKTCTRDTHSMLVVKGSVDVIENVLKDKKYEISCINSPVETVLSGSSKDISNFQESLADAGIRSTLLKVPYAFHSSQVDPIMVDFKKLAGGVTYSKPSIPVLSTLDGCIVNDAGKFTPEYLVRQCREPVNMQKTLMTAYSEHNLISQSMVLELGPHPAISGMVRAVLGQQVVCLSSSQRGRSSWQVLATTLKALYSAGADIRWLEYHRDFSASHKVISMPAYSWDLKEYWIQYVNDWSLRKGDPPLMFSNSSGIESTTIHRVVEETGDSEKTHIIVEADITRKDLSPLVQGHEVDGIPLCTPSVYADIALSLGKYVLERYSPNKHKQIIDVSEMTISKALILQAGATQQLLQAHADVDWASNAAIIKFMSFDSKQKLQEHSRCCLRFKEKSHLQVLEKEAVNLRRKMQDLREGIALGTAMRFNRPMVYRMIRPLARFHDGYRAIDEIVLNSKTLEASSHLSYGSVEKGGTFHTHPAIIDSLSQSCAFTMNCNDDSDLDVEVFMNHGWDSFQIFEPIDFDKEYTTYTKMVEGKDKLWRGDVVVFDGERIVACFKQIAIQGVPRRVLKVILSLESGSRPQKQRSTPNIATAPTKVSRDPAPVARESEASKISQALSIISEESGLAVTDLTDGTVFGDVGIDSLLGLTVSARFKEELDVDLDFNSLFYEYPTVSDLRALLGGSGDGLARAKVRTTPGYSTSEAGSATSSSKSGKTGITTPDIDDEIFSQKGIDFQQVLQIVSEESGMAIEDLTDDTNFADSGVDSLLSLVLVSRFRDELELDIQHESLFLECPTVADLKRLLLGDTNDANPIQLQAETKQISTPVSNTVGKVLDSSNITTRVVDSQNASLAGRKRAVDSYVKKYTAELSLPAYYVKRYNSSNNDKVILITGASGSLGGHLVYHIAALPDVKLVVCLNRENRAEPYVRQQKAMREKGIRFPEVLKHKLKVLQTDSSKPMFGLPRSEYEGLVNLVTHLIHNAWPMSAKRPLDGFESQFQVMRNLIEFAYTVSSRRPESFKFSFQMVSSIGVVGHYGLGSGKKTIVPEERVTIDAVLPNGYGEAKWGCERMLDETLHKYPDRFRTMAVRLGQIAGSKTSGYWNPMEHFGFLIKSSQTLNALPDLGGGLYWTPVNDVASALSDLVLSDRTPYPIYHIESPIGQSWSEMTSILADALKIPPKNIIPFEEWVERVRAAPQRDNPAATLLDFLDDNFLRMSCGGLVLDTKKTLEHSETLAALGPVSEEVARKYIHIWKEIGFLKP
ncbi:ketoacyl-synt-domain-containing protein [Lojkania enalia]|uniref:Ketoacyl-synt-domain-containing protein n=1 Tax=Lojkania enalia TaxID=147567 RepID=A0A9P4KHK5_9PLEO|nr:ketoacyl-synt-domain-containing protein [Didymosphaeria enalia]